MLLAIDIGNTNITLGLWDGDDWRGPWRLQTVADKTADEYGVELEALLRLHNGRVRRAIMASVVPALSEPFTTACEQYLGAPLRQVDASTPTGCRILTDNPAEVGPDRIANAVAAHRLYPGPSLVIDMGTATTFDAVSRAGDLLGVVIAPGLKLAAEALTRRAARLSQVPLAPPPQVLGKNTIHAVQSGLIFGYTALVEGIAHRLCNELAEPPERIIGTGGLINFITPHTNILDTIDPWLTLQGLRFIDEKLGRER